MVELTLPGEPAQEYLALTQKLEATSSTTTETLLSDYPASFVSDLGYDPVAAGGMDLISSSPLKLSTAEEAVLKQKGFVISRRQIFPSFAHGYEAIYMSDLPLYVSADSILDAVHRSYNQLLEMFEQQMLAPELLALVTSTHKQLSASKLPPTVSQDLDFYLGVARGLLEGSAVQPQAGANAEAMNGFIKSALEATGRAKVVIFGVERQIDFSQFQPRGHYADFEELQRYFRAMMWLGRIDFRLIETLSNGSQVFHRRQLEAVLGLWSIMSELDRKRHQSIDTVLGAFAGESDNLQLRELSALWAALGANSFAELSALSDQQIAQTIITGGFGQQRIASELIRNRIPTGGTLPLNRSFMLFGQRYTLDAHVFTNVVYDQTRLKRMMPTSLDVAFAALGNNQAAQLLKPELDEYQYASNLE